MSLPGRLIAREWLWFVACITPYMLLWFYCYFTGVYEPSGSDPVFWVGLLLIYVVVQLIRFTSWAVRRVRKP